MLIVTPVELVTVVAAGGGASFNYFINAFKTVYTFNNKRQKIYFLSFFSFCCTENVNFVYRYSPSFNTFY